MYVGFMKCDTALDDCVELAHIKYDVAGTNTILRNCGNVLVSGMMGRCITDRGGLISPRCITDGSLGIYEKGVVAPHDVYGLAHDDIGVAPCDVYGKPLPMSLGEPIMSEPIYTITKTIHS